MTLKREPARIVRAETRGGYYIICRGAVYWARTYPLAKALAEVVEEGDVT